MTRYGTSPPFNRYYKNADPSEFPTLSNRRKKPTFEAILARWTTKAVLLSPLLILSVWSIIIMFSGSRRLQQQQQQQMYSTSQFSSRNNGKKSHNSKHHNNGRKPLRPKRKGNSDYQNAVVQPANLQRLQQQLADFSFPNLGYVDQNGNFVALSSGTNTNENAMSALQSSPNVVAQQNLQQSSPNVAAQQNLQQMQQNTNYQENESIQTTDSSIMQFPEGSVVNNNGQLLYVLPKNKLNDQIIPSLQNTQNLLPITTATALKDLNAQKVPSLHLQGAAALSNDLSAKAAVDNSLANSNFQAIQTNNLAAEQPNVVIQPRSTLNSVGETKTLFYDPLAATVDGQLYVPQVVYDENGKEVDLKSLQSSDTAVYLEPPSSTQEQEQAIPAQKLSTSQFKNLVINESPAQDQSIILATVSVMALLVGAITARRLRSRNFVSACIENEALEEEDEQAYDVASTAGDYSTFSAGNWKGDLEKFDV